MSRSNKICSEIMRYLVSRGFTHQVHKKQVVEAIVYLRGPDKRTIKNWMRALEVLGFLERVNPVIFQMKLMACPELFVKVMKEPKQKKLM